MSSLRGLFGPVLLMLCSAAYGTGYSFRGIGFLPGGLASSASTCVSRDGSFIGANVRIGSGTQAAYSVNGGTLTAIPNPPSIVWDSSFITAFSGSASWAIGYGIGHNGYNGAA